MTKNATQILSNLNSEISVKIISFLFDNNSQKCYNKTKETNSKIYNREDEEIAKELQNRNKPNI